MYYMQKDYLGSYYCITDQTGRVAENKQGEKQVFSFDPCSVKLGFREPCEPETVVEPISTAPARREGRRRNPSDWSYNNVPTSYIFDRGYTGHQQMDVFGLINMNGRLYDPFLGRMLSPDPFVQAPGNSQNYNRYSYALNNPLKFTDPTGYTYKPNDWDAGVSWNVMGYFHFQMGGGGGGRNWVFSSLNSQMSNDVSYSYDWNTSHTYTATNGLGESYTVSYDEVFNNYITQYGTDITTSFMAALDGGIISIADHELELGIPYRDPWSSLGSGMNIINIDLTGNRINSDNQGNGSAGGGVYRSGDTQSFDNGLEIEYDLQDGVGIRSSAQVQGYFSISQYGQVSVYAEVFHGEKNIPYTYNGNVRFTVNGKQTFIPLSLNGESSIYNSLYSPIGFANYGLPSSGTVTMEIYIGYEVNTGAGYFNGEYYNGTFILGR